MLAFVAFLVAVFLVFDDDVGSGPSRQAFFLLGPQLPPRAGISISSGHALTPAGFICLDPDGDVHEGRACGARGSAAREDQDVGDARRGNAHICSPGSRMPVPRAGVRETSCSDGGEDLFCHRRESLDQSVPSADEGFDFDDVDGDVVLDELACKSCSQRGFPSPGSSVYCHYTGWASRMWWVSHVNGCKGSDQSGRLRPGDPHGAARRSRRRCAERALGGSEGVVRFHVGDCIAGWMFAFTDVAVFERLNFHTVR